ncbi:MAG: TolC family protein [Leptospiraceae bacterium]|nr:TolC family protein [Leptospiraceae bacterium]
MHLAVKFICLFLIIVFEILAEKISFWKSIELVKKNNPILVAKRYDLDLAKADVTTASLYPNPMFNKQILMQARPDTGNSGNPFALPSGGGSPNYLDGKYRQDWFQVTQVFPVAGQYQLGIQLAKKNLQLSRDNLLEFERNTLYLVQSKWIDAWYFEEKSKTLEIGRKYLEELIKTNKLRYKNQVITKTELDRTKILFELYSIEINLQRQYSENSLNSLRYLYGISTNVELEEKEFFINEDLTRELSQWIEFGLSKRSDVLVAKSLKESSGANLKLQESNAYPRPDAGLIYNPQNNDPYVGTFLTIPIAVNNRNQGNIQKAKADVLQSSKELEAKENLVVTEIQNSYREFIVLRDNLEKYEKIVQDANEIREIVQYSYLKGGTSVVDYLEVQRNWFQTQIGLIEASVQYRRGYLQLLYLSGRIHDK